MRKAYALVALSILLVGIALAPPATSFDFGIAPGKWTCKGGWNYTAYLELLDNTTTDMNITVTIQQVDNPENDYIKMTNLSWVSFNKNRTVHTKTVHIHGKNSSDERYTVTRIPVYVEIPDHDDNENKNYQCLVIAKKPDANNSGFSIATQLGAKLLVSTPQSAGHMPSKLVGICLLFLITCAVVGFYLYSKKWPRR